MGLCYRAPGGLAAGAGGRQEQAPSAMDSSSTLAESARERPELGMTPPSKVPDGFIHRPKLRFPSPLNFPALLFFFFFFGPVFPTRPIHFPEKYHSPHPLPASLPPFLPLPHHQHPHLIQSHLVNSSYSSHGEEKAFHVYSPFRSASSSLHLPSWRVERVYCALIMSVGVCVSVGRKGRKKEGPKDYHFWMY